MSDTPGAGFGNTLQVITKEQEDDEDELLRSSFFAPLLDGQPTDCEESMSSPEQKSLIWMIRRRSVQSMQLAETDVTAIAAGAA